MSCGVAQPTVSVVLEEVTNAINEHLCPLVIRMPNNEEDVNVIAERYDHFH